MQHCPTKGAPKCPPASKRYRTHDGTCNNVNHPRWGSTLTPVQRFLPPSYSDGLQAPRRSVSGAPLPSPREISSLVHESQNVESPGITHLLMQWGQFLDHDVTSSSQSRGFNGSVPRCCKNGGRDFVPKELMHPECFPIAVPSSDPFYGSRGVRCLEFVRSSPAPRDDCALGWREQLNQVSAYIDGSPLYASSARQSDKLRLFRNGMLQYGRVQQRRPILPPERRDELCRGGAVSTDCFRSGDARVNEHPGLVAAHIVWLRHHNRMAQELAHLNPHWSDEKIYQETRKILGAMVQHITYREFLPIVLGPEVMKTFELDLQKKGYYKGYSPKINPSPASSFGSAAFRFGHSLVQPSMMRYDRFHRPIHNNVSLHMEVTNPSNIWSMGAVDRLLLGMVNQPIQKRDEFITEELTNHLFQTPSFDFGMDLAAINIQRGRDHGVPSYTTWREPCGLSVITDFEDLFKMMPSRAVWKLKLLYRHVDDIDLFTGGMAERPVVGGLVGPTFSCIIAQQFLDLRKGDRFWYENGGFESSFTPAQLQQIRRISLAQVLCRTLDTITSIQPFAFLSPDHEDNDRISCQNGLLNNFDLSPWIEIDSENNDIRKSDDDHTTQKPKRTTSTQKPSSTTKKTHSASKVHSKRPQLDNTTKVSNGTEHKLTNLTDSDAKDDSFDLSIEALTREDNDKNNNMTIQIDDKLDFKNKTKRFDDILDIDSRNSRPKNKYGDYDYEDDDTQSIQSVVINNAHKRPYNNNYNNNNNRPSVLTVTENTNKYTYLINYVPRPTESYRQTTRRAPDRDVVKVTYQTYDDTYRRPNKPYYYNRHELNENYRHNRPNTRTTMKDSLQSSARSNDDTDRTTPKARPTEQATTKIRPTEQTTTKPRLTEQTRVKPRPTEQTTLKPTSNDKNQMTNIPTTENLYKLVTFGYVGTYRGDMTDDKLNFTPNNQDMKEILRNKHTDDDKTRETISKDFSTYAKSESVHENLSEPDNKEASDNVKLSTFYLHETATKPYNLQRSTRRNDDEEKDIRTSNKYYYVNNVLHRRPKPDSTVTEKPAIDLKKEIIKENYNYPGIPQVDAEERSAADLDSMPELDRSEPKAAVNRQRVKVKKPASPAKTPSVAFQVIPSEVSPSQWAVYEEDADLPEGLPHRTPPIKADPHALREIPRPINHIRLRRRRPGLF